MASRHRVCTVSYSVSRGSGSRTSGSMGREALGRGGRTGAAAAVLEKGMEITVWHAQMQLSGHFLL